VSHKLFKSTMIVASMTFISRILGLLREIVFASFFGATAGMDAFIVAFKIPNFLRRLFAEGAFNQAFVPVLAAQKTQVDQQQMRELIQRTMGTLGIVVFIVAIIGMLTSAVWVAIFAPGFWHDPAKFHLASGLLRITFPYLFFISLTALSGSVLNVYSRFAVPAITPVLLNICLIAAAIWLSPYFTHPVTAIAWGVLIAGVVQFLFQLPFLIRLKLLSWPRWGWRNPHVQRIIKLMVPVLFGASVVQVSLLVDTIFASFLKTGSVSWLYYSDRLMQFPLGVFGVALSTVVLPHLSKHHAKAQQGDYNRSLDWALRWVLVIGLPAAVGVGVLSMPLLVSLFHYGQFSIYDVVMSQESLIAFAVGLLFFIAVKVLVSAFYARQEMKLPVKIAVIAMLANIVLNGVLIVPLAHAGIALATSLAAALNALLLVWFLRKRKFYRPEPGWRGVSIAVVCACILMGLILWYCAAPLSDWAQWHAMSRVFHLVVLIVIGIIAYGVFTVVFGLRLRHLSR